MRKILLPLLCLLIMAAFAQSRKSPTFNRSALQTYVQTTMTRKALRDISPNFSVDKVTSNPDGTVDVRICVGPRDYDAFEQLGIPFTILEPDDKAVTAMADTYEQLVANWNRYPTYNAYKEAMSTFESEFPQMCDIDTILAQTPGNHTLFVAHISNDLHNRGGKPAFFYTATMHGDEPVGYYLMLRLIHYLLNNYDTDAQVRQLVDNVDIWICPLENPDGTYRSSNTQISGWYSTRYNQNGDDLNRSYPIAGQPVAKNYPPEVQAMMDFGAEHHFTLSANFHGGAEVVNYPWDTWTTIQRAHADQSWWDYIGRCYADTCHAVNANYMTDENNGITEGGDWYVITGSRQDYFNYYLGCREMTIEVSSDKVPSSNNLPTFWNRNRQSLLNYIGESLNGFRGIVTDSVTNQPIAARVFVENHDEDNSHTYSRLPYGDYHRPIRRGTWQVTFSAEGYFPKTLTHTATDGQCLVQDVQLVPTNISVTDRNLPKVSVYPNPASNEVRVTSDQEEIVLVELYDLAGRRLVRQTVGELSASLDLSSCASGVYNLTVTFASGKVSKRVVKQ